MRTKHIVAGLLAVTLLAALLMPVAAAPVAPFDASVAIVEGAVLASVGVDTVGAAVVLLKNGTAVMADGFGYADLDTRLLVTPDTVFEIGDLSALFVAATALLLTDEGRLDLDADIATYLPEKLVKDLALSYPVTTRQLLTGYAGFGGRVLDVSFDKDRYCFESLEEALLADVPQQVTVPGTVFAYSRFGMALAALVIEHASGMAYESYVTEHLLYPLGMNDTVLRFTADTVFENPAVGYRMTDNGVFVTDTGRYRTYAGLYPATGAASTAADLARFFGWLLCEGEAPLPRVGQELLQDAASTFAPTAMVLHGCGAVYSLGTATRFFGASLAFDRQKGELMLVLTNTAQNTLLSLPQTTFTGAALPLPLPEGEPLNVKDLTGTYLSTRGEARTLVGRLQAIGERVTVSANDDGTVEFLGMRLVQIARGVFADADGDISRPVVQFLLNEDGEVTAIVTDKGESYTPLPFYYSRVPAALLLGALLLLTAYFVLSGLLCLVRHISDRCNGRDVRLLPLLPDLFACFLGVLVAIQLLVAYNVGAAAISSAYLAMQILVLLAAIGTVVSYLFAFVFTVLDRKLHKRIAYSAILLLVFLFLICLFGLTVI